MKKYEDELKKIEWLAEQLDLQSDNKENKLELIDKIETIKRIDKLTMKLKNNTT